MTKRSSLTAVFLVVLVDLIGFGIVLPLLPFYADRFEVTPFMIGLLFSVFSLAQFFFSPIWGRLSDRIGRRPVMLWSTFGASLAYLVFALAPSFGILFLSRIFAGIMGGNIAAAQSYVADVTSHEHRAKGMGLIGAAFGIGFLLGPALAAALIHPAWISWLEVHGAASWVTFIKVYPYALPGLFASLLSLTSFCFVFFKLPESLPADKRKESRESERGWGRNVDAVVSAFRLRAKTGGKGHLLPILFISIGILSFGQSSLYGIFPLFCQMRFDMLPNEVGVFYMAMGLVAVLVQGGFLRVLLKRFSEELANFAHTYDTLTLFLNDVALKENFRGREFHRDLLSCR